MKRFLFLVGLSVVFCSMAAFTQEAGESLRIKREIYKGVFFDFGFIGNYEDANSKEIISIQSVNMLGEIGFGYDFGRVTLRSFFDIGSALKGRIDTEYDLREYMDPLDLKTGAEIGIKIIDAKHFGLILPLGWVFSHSEYTQKIPVEIKKTYGYGYGSSSSSTYSSVESKWIYQYHSAYSGLNLAIIFNKVCSLSFYGHYGYPFSKLLKFELKAPSGYIWKSTGSDTITETFPADIFSVSAGLSLRIKIPQKAGYQKISKSQSRKLFANGYYVAINDMSLENVQIGANYGMISGLPYYVPWYSDNLKTVKIDYQNTYTKEIGYVLFQITPLNALGRVVVPANGLSTTTVQSTGPFPKNEIIHAKWDAIWNDSTIVGFKIDNIAIHYIDGTEKVYSADQIKNIIVAQDYGRP